MTSALDMTKKENYGQAISAEAAVDIVSLFKYSRLVDIETDPTIVEAIETRNSASEYKDAIADGYVSFIFANKDHPARVLTMPAWNVARLLEFACKTIAHSSKLTHEHYYNEEA